MIGETVMLVRREGRRDVRAVWTEGRVDWERAQLVKRNTSQEVVTRREWSVAQVESGRLCSRVEADLIRRERGWEVVLQLQCVVYVGRLKEAEKRRSDGRFCRSTLVCMTSDKSSLKSSLDVEENYQLCAPSCCVVYRSTRKSAHLTIRRRRAGIATLW